MFTNILQSAVYQLFLSMQCLGSFWFALIATFFKGWLPDISCEEYFQKKISMFFNIFQRLVASYQLWGIFFNIFQKLNISQHFSAASCKRLVVRNIFQCFFSQYFSTFSAACCQGIVVRRGDGWRCEAVGWRRRGGGGGDKKIFH